MSEITNALSTRNDINLNPNSNFSNTDYVDLLCNTDTIQNADINLIDAIKNIDTTVTRNTPMASRDSTTDNQDNYRIKPIEEIKAPDTDGNGNVDVKEWHDAISHQNDENGDGIIDFTHLSVKL